MNHHRLAVDLDLVPPDDNGLPHRFFLRGKMTRKLSLCAFAILAVVIGCAPLLAQSTPYFQGKTIILVQGREPGGTGALRAQAAIPFLRKYLPGEPIIVTQFMPGGGGRKASNYIYHNAKPDGLTFANV